MINTDATNTEPFVSDSIQAIFNEVITVCIPRCLYHFMALMSGDDAEAFDREIVKDIEAAKWRYRAAGYNPEVRYFRHARWCLLFTNESSFLNGTHTGDIRERPVSFCGYVINCKWNADRASYEGIVEFGPDYLAHRTEKAKVFAERDAAVVGNELRSLLQVHTPAVHKQVEGVLEVVNRVRKSAGLELVTPAQAGLEEAVVLTLSRH